MFQDCNYNAVGFKPEAKQARRTVDADSQTSSLDIQDAYGQSIEYVNKLVQTEEAEPQPQPQYDEEKLADFLKKTYPVLLKELNNPGPSTAGIENGDRSFADKNRKIYEIKAPFVGGPDETVRVSASVWKKDSHLACFGYSYKHEDWCCHTSKVYIYTLNMATSQLVTPKILDTPSCVTSLQYHPTHPTILAGSMYNGEVVIWDIHREDSLLASSKSHTKDVRGHKDAISQISWIRNIDINQEQPMLVTSGTDGFILLWQFNPFTGELTMFARFSLRPPVGMNKASRNPVYSLFEVDAGVTSFSFSPDDPSTFIAGLDGGDVLKCGITDMCFMQAQREMHILELCPVVGFYERHSGTVTDVEYMRHESRVSTRFITASVDRTVKIFEENKDVPICVFHCEEVIMGLMFCDVTERLLLAWGSQRLYYFDAQAQEHLGSSVLGNETCNKGNTSVSTNGKRLVAVGNSRGDIAVWEISDIVKKE